jgi:hypothetical protein
MAPLDHLLAVAVLTAAPTTADRPVPAPELAHLRPVLRSLALSWELLDPREKGHVFAREQDFDGDLDFVRQRQHNLADAPPLADCLRFPDHQSASARLAFNRAYRQHLRLREQIGGPWPDEVREAIRETDQLYQAWDAVHDARCESYYVSVRRQALRALREAIGFEAYLCGTMPPHVPFWRFTRAD